MTEIREHEEFTKVKNIERIELGRYEMETWYFSPFPDEVKDCKVRAIIPTTPQGCAQNTQWHQIQQPQSFVVPEPPRNKARVQRCSMHDVGWLRPAATERVPCMQKLYICEFTLAFFPQREQLLRHIDKSKRRCPPGTEIYRNGNISMFEVDGAVYRTASAPPATARCNPTMCCPRLQSPLFEPP